MEARELLGLLARLGTQGDDKEEELIRIQLNSKIMDFFDQVLTVFDLNPLSQNNMDLYCLRTLLKAFPILEQIN